MADPETTRQALLAEAEAWAYEPHDPQFPYRTGRLIDRLAALAAAPDAARLTEALRDWAEKRRRYYEAAYDPDAALSLSPTHPWVKALDDAELLLFRLATEADGEHKPPRAAT